MQRMARHPTRNLALFLLAGGVLPLAFALTTQYGFGLPPCHFCLLQRYPYVLVAVCGATLFLLPKKPYPFTALAIIGWLTTAALGLYHTGIEEGWVAYRGGCVADASTAATLEELRAQIAAAPRVSCDAPLAEFLGLSMASWNALGAFGLIGIALYLYRYRR